MHFHGCLYYSNNYANRPTSTLAVRATMFLISAALFEIVLYIAIPPPPAITTASAGAKMLTNSIKAISEASSAPDFTNMVAIKPTIMLYAICMPNKDRKPVAQAHIGRP